MRELQLTLKADSFGLIWRSLHAEEARLLEVIASKDEDSDEALDAANDIVYLRLYRNQIKEQAEAVFGAESSIFLLEN